MRSRTVCLVLVCLLLAPTLARAQLQGPTTISALDAGACATANACATFIGQGNVIAIDVSGTFVGTLTFEATIDDVNWRAVSAQRHADYAWVTTTTTAGSFSVANAGFIRVRLRATAWTSGSAVVIAARGFVQARASSFGGGGVVAPAGMPIAIAMAEPSTLAATPSQLGTDLAAGVYTITVTAIDQVGGQTDDPAAITCTVTAGGTGRCAITWTAVPGAVSYRAWTSLVDAGIPTRYFSSTPTSYNLDTLTGATVASLPTANSAHAVYFSGTAKNWLAQPLVLVDGTAADPSLTFLGDTTLGFRRAGTGRIDVVYGGDTWLHFDAGGGVLTFVSTVATIAWFEGGTYATQLGRGAAGIVSGGPYNTTIQIGDPGAKPACDAARRGTFWHDRGAAGVKDTVEICAKDDADAYAWRVIY